MTILNDFALSITEFTWDRANPNASTNGQFDPAKAIPGTGSCSLQAVLVKRNVDRKHFASAEDAEEVEEKTYIIGQGETPP